MKKYLLRFDDENRESLYGSVQTNEINKALALSLVLQLIDPPHPILNSVKIWCTSGDSVGLKNQFLIRLGKGFYEAWPTKYTLHIFDDFPFDEVKGKAPLSSSYVEYLTHSCSAVRTYFKEYIENEQKPNRGN